MNERRAPEVPDEVWFDPVLGARMHTGVPAVEACYTVGERTGPVAMDIETPGLDDALTLNCVTAAWHGADGRVVSVLLDPQRRPDHAAAVRVLTARAPATVWHGGAFDMPGMVQAGLMDRAAVRRVWDTLVAARMAYPDPYEPKSLAALTSRLLGWEDFDGGMALAFKAAGYKRQDIGYARMDISAPIYRMGAMADTVATLRLGPLLSDAVVDRLTDHPFQTVGITDRAGALARLEREQRVNRIMAWRGARGIAVDREYLHTYRDSVAADVDAARVALAEAGIRPGVGADLVERLERDGVLPGGWPRTATGRLSSAKGHLAAIEHPLASAHRTVAETDKVLNYLDSVMAGLDSRGRVHPQCGVLGASATGRMSYSGGLAVHQFSADARPILLADPGSQGLSSVDYCLAGDTGVETPYDGVIPLREVRVGQTVWSWSNGRVVIGRVTAHDRMRDRPCLKVTLDNGESFVCSDNHRMLMRDGTKRRADELAPGDSLAAFRRTTDAGGYEIVYSQSAFRYTKTHRAVGEHFHGPLPGGWHTHHVNEDKRDNRPTNLQYLPASVHAAMTPVTEARRAASSRNARRMVESRRSYVGAGNPNYGKLHGEYRACSHCGGAFYVSRANAKRGQGTYCSRTCYSASRWTESTCLNCDAVFTHRVSKAGKFCSKRCAGQAVGNRTNHKVVAVEEVGPRDLWDMTVEGEHNYALACGVFSSNSQIEPVTLANLAGDSDFLEPFEAGADLYEPIQRAAGIDRKTAKVVLLAALYGQGDASLAKTIRASREGALQIKRQMFSTMRRTAAHMGQIDGIARDTGLTITGSGRVLPMPVIYGEIKTHAAVNYRTQGSAYDILSHAILALDDAGLSDHIVLAMHDELVVDTDVADEVQALMEQPPEWLVRLSGRTPVLRTDNQPMGKSWKKV